MKLGPAIALSALCATLSACASTGQAPTALLTVPPGAGAVVASLPDLTTLGNTPTLNGSVTEVYSRIASKSLTCWFSTDGPLKATHVFSADAPPPSKGGNAEITIFEKDLSAANPRSIRAYRVTLAPEGDEHTRLTLQSGKLPTDLAQAMEKDVLAWGAGKESCEARVVRPPPPPPPVAEPKTSKKKKAAVKTATAKP